MAINPEDILVDAYAKSKKNQPGKIATESTELLGVVNRVIRTFFSIAVRVNPYFFGDEDDVAFSSGWPRPVTAEAIYRIEFTSNNAEVVVVPFDDRTAEEALPAVYRMGQVFQSAGNASDPTNENLTFYFSRVAVASSALDDPIDALFPEAYKELADLEVALYLAIKDQREAETAALVMERDRWLLLFLAFLEHETLNERRRWGHINPFNVPSVVPIASLLSGGSSVEI